MSLLPNGAYMQYSTLHSSAEINSVCWRSYWASLLWFLIWYSALVRYRKGVEVQWGCASAIKGPLENLW